jgi:hypothetical protein
MLALHIAGLVLAMQAPTDTALANLISQAQTAGARYENRAAAVRSGYRRIGPDTPDMGEHWIQPAVLVDARLDFAHPSVLTYARIDGVMKLTGVAYAIPIGRGEVAPALPSGLQWHQHAGSVHEELAGGIQHDVAASVPRLAMLHVWIGVANPAGIFVEENWALPFVRLGQAVPEKFDHDAARAVSLMTVGEAYYKAEIITHIGREYEERIVELTRAARERAASIIGDARENPMSAATLTELASAWRHFVEDVRKVGGAGGHGLGVLLSGKSAH